MDYGLIQNKINRNYVKEFVEKELTRRNTSDRRKRDAFGRLKIILNELAPNKDMKKLTLEESRDIAVKLVERYKKYWSVSSYFQITRQFIRYLHDLEDGEPLPKNFKPIKTPNQKSYKNIYRTEESIISPEEAFEMVVKNSRNKRESAIFMLLLDLGLRPHELIRGAKKKDIITDKLHHYHFRVDDASKTGKRMPMLTFSISFVQDYIETLKPEDYLFKVSDQIVWRLVKRISEGKCSPYDLRASSMSFFGLFLTDRELKERYGSMEFRHYVRLSKQKLTSKLDILSGRDNNGEGEGANLKKISPKFCNSCQHYNKYDCEICNICKLPLDPGEAYRRQKMDEIAYKSVEKLLEISPESFMEIARSFGAEVKKKD